ncbi:hypothetical protein SO802_003484 [Lithocarpus litseifolius]|uniref:RNase H type-1 domain-containing protein n=1 Tax=Lithocarpus litseifolius TaxID=425828 RepID=A0AAW2E462_9ROSI
MDMVWYGVVEAEWDKDLIEKMVMVAWSLWTSKNEYRTGGVKKSVVRIGSDALEYLEEYQTCVKEPEHSQVVQAKVWKPPPSNMFKINIDGVVFADQKAAGVDVLIRDELGNTIGALSKKLWATLKVVEIEAKAVEIALQFSNDLLIQDSILEGDSLLVINALKELSPPLSSVAAIRQSSLLVAQEFRQDDITLGLTWSDA